MPGLKMNKFKKIKAIVTLSHYTGSQCGWRMQVQDDASGLLVFEMELTDAQLGHLLGHAATKVNGVEVLQSDDIGRRMETKTIHVPIPNSVRFDPRARVWKAYVDGVEAEQAALGWNLDRDGRFNHHRLSGDPPTYAFVVRRWITDGTENA